MAREKLTAERIRNFVHDTQSPTNNQSFLWDTQTTCLAVRATANSKVFIFQSRLSGATIRMKIGDVTTWGIDQARNEARRLQRLIDKGVDPRTDKAEKMAETAAKRVEVKRQDVTVSEAWNAYVAARRTHWGDLHYTDHVTAARLGGKPKARGKGLTNAGPLAPLLALKLVEITPEHIQPWLKEEAAARPTQAKKAFSLFGAFLKWCKQRPEYRGLAADDAMNDFDVRQYLPKIGAKDDCLQREQLSAWFNAVRHISNPILSAYIQTLLLTGARSNELLSLKWDDINFVWYSLTIHDKVEGERTIPLTPYVSRLLTALPRRNQWVFSSPISPDGKLTDPGSAHRRARKAAGLPEITLHGLRRSFGTLGEWIVECPEEVIKQIMGHKPKDVSEIHYRRRPLDLLRLWHTKIEEFIVTEAGIEYPAERATSGLRLVGT